MARQATVTIANGQQLSAVIPQTGHDLLSGVDVPAGGFTGATIALYGCDTATGTPKPLTWEGTPIAFAVTAGDRLRWDPVKVAGERYLFLYSASAEAAERELGLKYRAWQ